MPRKPVAFMSYVRLDDQHENGRLSQFRERLSGEVRMQTGEEFEIFQDRNDIRWGQQWKRRIEESLDAVTFLIPVITPPFFRSPACRGELERFIKHEEKLGRNDLILPVYYVECPILSDEIKRKIDPLATAIAARQFADWRELRFEPFTTPDVGKRFCTIARQIVEAMERGKPEASEVVEIAQPSDRKVMETGSPLIEQTAQQMGDKITIESGGIPGPIKKNEIPAIVVDALHRGDYSTINEALKVAAPGTRIMVRPGWYKEGLMIDKPIEIVGDGYVGDIVVEASGTDTVLFKTGMGRIANMTLRQAGGGEWHCVDIAQGRLDLDGCDISSQSLSCVVIHNDADPRLRRNRIHDSKNGGKPAANGVLTCPLS
jgi:F-box protein 11